MLCSANSLPQIRLSEMFDLASFLGGVPEAAGGSHAIDMALAGTGQGARAI